MSTIPFLRISCILALAISVGACDGGGGGGETTSTPATETTTPAATTTDAALEQTLPGCAEWWRPDPIVLHKLLIVPVDSVARTWRVRCERSDIPASLVEAKRGQIVQWTQMLQTDPVWLEFQGPATAELFGTGQQPRVMLPYGKAVGLRIQPHADASAAGVVHPYGVRDWTFSHPGPQIVIKDP
jgi:hypothetical protein